MRTTVASRRRHRGGASRRFDRDDAVSTFEQGCAGVTGATASGDAGLRPSMLKKSRRGSAHGHARRSVTSLAERHSGCHACATCSSTATSTPHSILQATVDHDLPALNEAIVRLLQEATKLRFGSRMTESDSGFPLDGPVADLEPNRTMTKETGVQTAGVPATSPVTDGPTYLPATRPESCGSTVATMQARGVSRHTDREGGGRGGRGGRPVPFGRPGSVTEG